MEGLLKEPSVRQNKGKIIIGALAVIGIIGAIVLLAPSSEKAESFLITEFQLEQEEFKSYLLAYNKQYSASEEYSSRFEVFRSNLAFIRLQNAQRSSWKLKLNKFADLSHSEFKEKLLGTKVSFTPKVQSKKVNQLFPSTVDWRNENVVTPVKDQEDCGSCWAFSATGAIESAWALAGHELVSLSEQQLVDCSSSYGNYGCGGGLMDFAFKYVIANGGISLEKDYPYKGYDQLCHKLKAKHSAAKIKSFNDVTSGDMNALASAVAQQPVSVAVDASTWQFYGYGVLDEASCGTSLNHGVLAVGYNIPEAYWTVKNSWGSSWGETGYIRLSMVDGNGACGIQMAASYPVVHF